MDMQPDCSVGMFSPMLGASSLATLGLADSPLVRGIEMVCVSICVQVETNP